MKTIKWDLLQAEDIEVRVANKIKDTNNVAMLLYQDSRCTARNLDKQFGQFGWQIDYKVVGQQIYGTLSIYDEEKQQWVCKSDTGDKSNISEDKGQSSDILKRCAVRWGFGTELYTSPRIVVEDDGYGNSGYKVSKIQYNDNREIIQLTIVNRFNKEVFNWSINNQPVNNNIPCKQTNNHVNDIELTTDKDEEVNNIINKRKFQFNNKQTPTDILNEFYNSNKDNTDINQNELNRFYKYYQTKIASWNGKFDVNSLWTKWTQNNK